MFAVACGGSDDASDGNPLAERWLRLGEEPDTSVTIYERALPPHLVDLLNQDAFPDTAEEDLISFPVHPDGDLLGSYTLRMADGTNLVWLVYEVPLDERDMENTIAAQLDESPWQVTSMQANPTITVVQFQTTTGSDIEGSAIMQAQPAVSSFTITVERDGSERTLEFDRGAYIPLIEAALDDSLTVLRVDVGAARLAGLEEDDRIVAVGDTEVGTRRELARALRELSPEDEQNTALTYILQIRPSAPADTEPFVAPASRELPDRFPAREIWSQSTVVEFRWVTGPAGRGYQAGLLSTDSPTVAAEAIRGALEAADWEIVEDRPSGFATILEFAHVGDSLVGRVDIDTFPRDADYTLIVVEIQSVP